MFSKDMLGDRQSLFLKPADEETKVFLMSLNRDIRYEIWYVR